MKRKPFLGNSFLKKMLFSIVGLICIPMIGIQLYMMINTNREFRQENNAYYQRAVQSLALSFDKQLSSLSASAYRMQTDAEVLRPLTEDIRGYDMQIVAEIIFGYSLDSPLVNSVGVYYVEKDVVLFNGNRYTLERVCDKLFPANSQGHVDMVALLKGKSGSDVLYTGAYPDAMSKQLIVAKPLEIGGGKARQAVAFFLIPDKVFDRWCDVFVPNGQSFAVFDNDGNRILGGDEFFSKVSQNQSFRDFISDYEPLYVPAENENTLVYKYQELETGYTYMACVSKDTAEAKLNQYTAQAASSVVVSMILSAILLCVTLYINYIPVHRIVKKHIGIDSRRAKVSELELINTHLFAQDERITSQNQLLESFVVGDLLSGIGTDVASIEKYFPANTYHSFVAALSMMPMTTAQSTEACKAFAAKAQGKLVITTVPYRTEMVFVCALEKQIDLEELQSQLEETVNCVMGRMPEIRLGTVVESVGEIQSSYNNALLTNRIYGETDDMQLEGYPQALVADFAVHVSNREWDGVLLDLDGLERVNRELKPSVKRFVHLKVLNYFLSNVQKGECTLSVEETNQLLSYTNGQHLYNMIRRMVNEIKQSKNTEGDETASELRLKLLDYVNQNFTSSELCLSSAADYLKTSIYTVSRIFKEITGFGFKEYITEKRLQHACMLLQQTSMSISNVSAACGFENADYFTVIFRKTYGMAPSKFRKEAALNVSSNTQDL